jgi:hypothetical protein
MLAPHRARTRSRFTRRPRAAALETLSKHDSLIVLGVGSPKQKGDRRVRRQELSQPLGGIAIGRDFALIAPLELNPSGRVMAEPATERRGRREVPQPDVHASRILAETARPDPIDEDTEPIVRRRRFVDTLRLQHTPCYRRRTPARSCQPRRKRRSASAPRQRPETRCHAPCRR